MSKNDIPVQEIGEMLDMVSTKLPKMIKDIMVSLFSAEAATSMGKAVGIFYKELINAGIKQDDALQMTKDYMNTLKSLAPTDMMKNN